MFWVMITLLIVMAVSFLLDIVDEDSINNRYASLSVRGLAIFICLMAILDKYAG